MAKWALASRRLPPLLGSRYRKNLIMEQSFLYFVSPKGFLCLKVVISDVSEAQLTASKKSLSGGLARYPSPKFTLGSTFNNRTLIWSSFHVSGWQIRNWNLLWNRNFVNLKCCNHFGEYKIMQIGKEEAQGRPNCGLCLGWGNYWTCQVNPVTRVSNRCAEV